MQKHQSDQKEVDQKNIILNLYEHQTYIMKREAVEMKINSSNIEDTDLVIKLDANFAEELDVIQNNFQIKPSSELHRQLQLHHKKQMRSYHAIQTYSAPDFNEAHKSLLVKKQNNHDMLIYELEKRDLLTNKAKPNQIRHRYNDTISKNGKHGKQNEKVSNKHNPQIQQQSKYNGLNPKNKQCHGAKKNGSVGSMYNGKSTREPRSAQEMSEAAEFDHIREREGDW